MRHSVSAGQLGRRFQGFFNWTDADEVDFRANITKPTFTICRTFFSITMLQVLWPCLLGLLYIKCLMDGLTEKYGVLEKMKIFGRGWGGGPGGVGVCVKLFYNGYFFAKPVDHCSIVFYLLYFLSTGIHLYFIINNYKVHLYNRTQGFTHCKFCWSYQQVSPRGGSRNQSSKTNVHPFNKIQYMYIGLFISYLKR